ncbi:MAG: lipid-A-disaccharide synthase [Phycisphaerae bacterium]|nr:lipid-A-disaccharide synthase [Phycisphaerae bacterium]NIP54911.1 lipid-A-disaccharide synthase [Phycisphaerae bacterium]NIS53637.1 lipid-A-disaccharide synthase [Phycisphaerae bacterium]NIU11203.1 lipid-A-disaccharide synthase [Phycisphaerae bacterium]NIU59057.1 lipid-A-disaccharide synthase [Phycisphaerae bacterium]
MPDTDKKYRIFLSAAEPSADAHCAGLITSLQQRGYDIEFVGVGGPKMAAAGCNLLESTTGKAAMIYNAFKEVLHFIGVVRRIKRYFKNNKVDLVIVCDSPSFNFHVAKAAKSAGIKTIFYVAPQLWAWASWRIRKLRKFCDKLCCILPFEQDWFGQRGLEAVFVGHPMLDELHIDLPGQRRNYADFNPANSRIAIMPGSRNAEINSLWLPMQQIATRLKKKYPEMTFVTVAVDAEKELILKEKQIPAFDCQYTIGSVNETARSADFAIVASGSATLEVTAAGCPMVIMYQSSWILWHLVGWWLVKSRFLSLVNILAEKELVPEFMPYFTSIDPIVESIENLLEDSNGLSQLSGDLINLVKPLAEKKASEEVAVIVVDMLQ